MLCGHHVIRNKKDGKTVMEKENVMAVFFFFRLAGKSRKARFAYRNRVKRREGMNKSEKSQTDRSI